jgi:hypothetical protein
MTDSGLKAQDSGKTLERIYSKIFPEPKALSPEPANDSPLHTAPPTPLRTPADCFLWSEKTTVCRIFSCKRARTSFRVCGLFVTTATSYSTIRAHSGASRTADFKNACDSVGPPPRFALRWATFVGLAHRGLANRSSLRSVRCQAERLASEGWRIPGSNR